jgi:hypothetical protein
MAPQRCSRRGAPVANGGTSPSDAWASQTTLIKAGEDLAP